MGSILSRLRRNRKIVIVGLSGAGKTSISSFIKGKKTDAVSPTRGFKITKHERNSRKYVIWDLGGDKSMRNFWKCYFNNVSGIIYVLDGCDSENKHDALGTLVELARDKQLYSAVFMVLVHKGHGELNFDELKKNLSFVMDKRKFGLFKTTIEEPETVETAIDWFFKTIG